MQQSEGHNDLIAAGFNYRMNEMEAVLGLVQLPDLERLVAERESLAYTYMERLKDVPGMAFQEVIPGCRCAWQALVIRLRDRDAGDILKCLRKAGVEANIGTYAVHLLSFDRNKYGYQPSAYPNAETLHFKTVALPLYNGLTENEIEHVSDQMMRLL